MKKFVLAFAIGAALALAAGPVMGRGPAVMERVLGPEHPAVVCFTRDDSSCNVGQFLLVWALTNVKHALPEDSEHQKSLDNLIEFYSNPERQAEWQRSFEEADRYFDSQPRRRPLRPRPTRNP